MQRKEHEIQSSRAIVILIYLDAITGSWQEASRIVKLMPTASDQCLTGVTFPDED